jgi:hypothetical protein
MQMKLRAVVLAVAVALIAAAPAGAERFGSGHHGRTFLWPGNLLVSRSVYDGSADLLTPGTTVLPPGCTSSCAMANADGTYPFVFNNDVVDASFGVTSKILLDQLTPWGARLSTIDVPDGDEHHGWRGGGRIVTSFPSKSELALNLSLSGRYVTFMGYDGPVNGIDVSNSNTPLVIDASNPVTSTYYRVVAQLDRFGRFRFTRTNAYSGNNGRAAIFNDEPGAHVYYTAGNAGNGSATPQPTGVIAGAGAQILTPSHEPERAQMPGFPTPLGSFNITQLGDKADKIGKDTNFRGLTVFHNVVYYTKGSGGNGVNTVYFVDTTGKACPNGVGLPAANAALPTSPLAYDPSVLQTQGLQPDNMCILKGFPTALKSKTAFPFGLWFANDHTLYVADEGDGDNTFSGGVYTKAAGSQTAGLQKWVFDDGAQTWKLAYTLQSGLGLGQPYTISGYPTGTNALTKLPWAPATDGLRNITGRVNRDGSATIWAITSTVSGGGDQGADPNKLVAITDPPSASTAAAGKSFTTLRIAGAGEVLRGISFTPGTGVFDHDRNGYDRRHQSR